jgi:hypothetical protein
MRYGNPSLLSGLQNYDKGVTEVLFLCIHNMPWLQLLILAEEHRQKYFPG